MASGAALAADSAAGSNTNNGQANAAADAGAVAPDARQNIAPNNTGNSQINTGSGTTGTTGTTGTGTTGTGTGTGTGSMLNPDGTNSSGTGVTNGTGNSSTTGGTNSVMGNDDPSKMSNDGMSKDDQHRNSMCKDGKCPDQSGKVDTERTPQEQKTDGTTQ
ncbi:YbgS-like family protein [Leclercia adecarboxylata]|nr:MULTISPECIES: YbgS-like family protein [Leclercia]MEB5749294.1 YbgS-like family protein [Leclercia adecarboxylata]UYM58056.1 YbgS-like family protein [Leclercia adecarboxylata]